MSAKADIVGLTNYAPYAWNTLKGARRAFVQSVQTVKYKVPYDMGPQRRLAQQALDESDSDRVVGGLPARHLQDYDAKLNILECQLLLMNTMDDLPSGDDADGIAFEARASVFSSMAGIVVPAGVETNSDFRRMFRFGGFAPYDTLIQNVGNGTVPYGTAGFIAGSVSGTYHQVPEPIGVGQFLWCDVGPRSNADRAHWSKDFYYNQTDLLQGAEHAVLRPWDPYGASDFLCDGVRHFLVSLNPLADYGTYINPASREVNSSLVHPAAAVGNALASGLMTAVLYGVAVLEKAGYVTINAAPPPRAAAAPVPAYSAALPVLAERLGLLNNASGRDSQVVTQIFGMFYQQFIDDEAAADSFSASSLLNSQQASFKLQQEGAFHLVQAVVDTYYEHAAYICAKSSGNSQQRGFLQFVLTG